jgi:hypothetical protein
MELENSDSIFLTDLAKGFPAITPVFAATLAEACAVCLSDRKHPQGINLMPLTKLTDFTVIERSRKGTGFDYWLGSETNDVSY